MILGTAGHIDHGKTALVKALTGVDTDRLAEEKRRGITIELGFAPLALNGAGTVGVVDVPGHDAFVRTMLAGATGVDLALLVIAADEGVMPQTREHLAILSLLGVRDGVVALTKSDLVDGDWIALVEQDVRALIRGTALAGAAIIPCSAATGAGLDALRAELSAAARRIPERADGDIPRLPIDRAFSVKGIGTVVTGTLWSGTFAPNDEVRVVPGDVTARVRSIESHATAVNLARPGNRTAVALSGVRRAEIKNGATLVRASDPWQESRALRADVTLLDGAKALGVRTQLRFHLGTAETGARVVAARGKVEPGETVPVRIVLDAPVVARSGDRFVLRAASPAATIGGGIITDAHPPARRAKPWGSHSAGAGERLGWIVAESGGAGVPLSDLVIRIGISPYEVAGLVTRTKSVVVAGDRVFGAALKTELRTRVSSAVAMYHASHPMDAGIMIERVRQLCAAHHDLVDLVISELQARKSLTVRGNILARAGFVPLAAEVDAEKLRLLAEALEQAGPRPESVDELSRTFGPDTLRLLKVLEKQKRAVAVAADRYFSPAAVQELLNAVQAAVPSESGVTASQLREILGVTRKYLIPFLEYCDRQRISTRSGDVRIFHWKG